MGRDAVELLKAQLHIFIRVLNRGAGQYDGHSTTGIGVMGRGLGIG